MTSNLSSYLVLLAILAVSRTALCLVLIRTNSTLPSPRRSVSAVYDNADTIYIIGGDNHNCISCPYNEVLKYSISTDTIEQVFTLPSDGHGGSMQMDVSGQIYYFAAQGNNPPWQSAVYKFYPATNLAEEVRGLGDYAMGHSSVKYNLSSDITYLFGGYGNPRAILSYNMKTYNTSTIGGLPYQFYHVAAVNWQGFAFLFGREEAYASNLVYKIDLKTFQAQIVNSNFTLMSYAPSAVATRDFVYVLGGYGAHQERTSGFLRFNPVSYAYSFVPVENFMIEEDYYFSSPPWLVYVEKLNRIYLFGGRADNGQDMRYYDNIWTNYSPNNGDAELPFNAYPAKDSVLHFKVWYSDSKFKAKS